MAGLGKAGQGMGCKQLVADLQKSAMRWRHQRAWQGKAWRGLARHGRAGQGTGCKQQDKGNLQVAFFLCA